VIRIGLLALAVSACTAGASASPVATDQVQLPKSYRFAPEVITVAEGTTVIWTNDDNFSHSVQLRDEPPPGQVLKPGAQATRTFDVAGTFPYVCTFHPQDMAGTVIVTGG
jgi:plastocyanin